MVSVTIKPTDSRLVAVKAALLYSIPELTGSQINRAAFVAVVTIERLQADEDHDQKVMSES